MSDLAPDYLWQHGLSVVYLPGGASHIPFFSTEIKLPQETVFVPQPYLPRLLQAAAVAAL